LLKGADSLSWARQAAALEASEARERGLADDCAAGQEELQVNHFNRRAQLTRPTDAVQLTWQAAAAHTARLKEQLAEQAAASQVRGGSCYHASGDMARF
jgi:enoyl-CoA hydratase/carnithine racemase